MVAVGLVNFGASVREGGSVGHEATCFGRPHTLLKHHKGEIINKEGCVVQTMHAILSVGCPAWSLGRLMIVVLLSKWLGDKAPQGLPRRS